MNTRMEALSYLDELAGDAILAEGRPDTTIQDLAAVWARLDAATRAAHRRDLITVDDIQRTYAKVDSAARRS